MGSEMCIRDRVERYIVGIGAANIDLMGRSRAPLVMELSLIHI